MDLSNGRSAMGSETLFVRVAIRLVAELGTWHLRGISYGRSTFEDKDHCEKNFPVNYCVSNAKVGTWRADEFLENPSSFPPRPIEDSANC